MDGLFLSAEQVAVGIYCIASAVDIALGKQSEYGIHHAVMCLDVLIVGENGLGNKLGNTNFLHMGVVHECFLDIIHV